jgi:AcrR family transcriptional regulator
VKPPDPGDATDTPARARLLDAAERLFMERGYAGVALKEIAAAAGIRQASLYHHAPGGKEELYVAAVLRAIERHHAALQAMAEAPGEGLEAELLRIGLWLASEPPMHVGRILLSDLPHLAPPQAACIRDALHARANAPLLRVFERAAAAGLLRVPNPALAAGGFRAMMQAAELARSVSGRTREETVRGAVDLLLRGILRQAG